MDLLQLALILLAGVGAGAINAAVGSGTLITFPALVAFGVPPVTATMSNAIGLIPGGIAGSLGYREEIRGQGRRLLSLLPASIAGSLIGALLLLVLPEDAFETIVPVLIVLALILVVVQPMLQKRLKEKKAAEAVSAAESDPGSAGVESSGAVPALSGGRLAAVVFGVFATAIYGGYFAAAQGIILIAVLALLLPDPIQRLNGAKNVLVLAVNCVSATIFMIVGWDRIDWTAVALIAVGSLIGGYFGARIARRFPPALLRGVIVVLGLIAFVRIVAL